MFGQIRKWQQKNRELAEINGPYVDAHDMAVSRADLQAIAEISAEVGERQTAMAHRHGLDERTLRVYAQDAMALTHACAHCTSVDECNRYLASDAPAGDSADFCPNHDAYQQLAQN